MLRVLQTDQKGVVWAAVLVPSPAGFGDDHLCPYLMKLHPETHVLQGDRDGALRVGLQAGGSKCFTWCFNIYQGERENRDFRWRRGHQHRTASPAQIWLWEAAPKSASQFQYPKLPNSTRCCNRWALAICSYGTCQPQITAAYSVGSAQVSECCDFTQEGCQEPVPQ